MAMLQPALLLAMESRLLCCHFTGKVASTPLGVQRLASLQQLVWTCCSSGPFYIQQESTARSNTQAVLGLAYDWLDKGDGCCHARNHVMQQFVTVLSDGSTSDAVFG